ncbi:peptidylprolyl isomerase [Streptosporangiaceae bacterium NEAU-GS5]|nr:peptidylprolyl isomerase [Streptosporangiaceae bacterium NEAU-GS5]
MVTGKDRQKELARKHYEKQQQRREEQRRKARTRTARGAVVGVIVVIGAVVGGVLWLNKGGGGTTTATASPAPTASAAAAAEPKPYDAAAGTCGYVATEGETAAKDVGGLPPAQVSTAPATMTIDTNLGKIEAKLDAAKAPCTVASFKFLASKKYFSDTICHRLTTQGIKVLQCGDPTGTGSGGPGYRFVDENLKDASYKRGVLAMANAGPNTNGSQFFIVYGDETDSLPDSYTPFGTITKGMDIVDKVAKDGVKDGASDGAPKTEVKLKDVTISSKS